MRTAYGAITFNGVGAYTYTGSQIIANGAPAAFTGTGTYSVKSTGYVTISNPQRAGTDLNAGLGQGAVVASSTEGTGVYDLFVAIQAPAGGQSNASLSGNFDISALEFPTGAVTQMRNAAFRLAAGGNGSAGTLTVTGKAANASDRVATSTIANATYTVTTDGGGCDAVRGVGGLAGDCECSGTAIAAGGEAEGGVAHLGAAPPGNSRAEIS